MSYFIKMLIIYLLFETVTSWKYPTFDELNVHCALCTYITNRFEDDTSKIDLQITPSMGSLCEKDKLNDICQNTEAIAKNFQNAVNKTNYCRRTGFCPEEVPKGIIGQKCQICLMLTKHVLNYPIEDRKTAFHNFCNTSNVITSVFCGDIYDESVDDFLDDLKDLKTPFKFCHISHFCRNDPNKKQDIGLVNDDL